MRLTRLQRQAFIHHRAEWDFVQETDIDAGDRDCAALTAAYDGLAQHVRAVGAEVHRDLCFFEYRIEATVTMRFGPNCVNAAIRSAARSHLHQTVVDILLLEVES